MLLRAVVTDAVLAAAPFPLFANDSDVELLSEGWDDEAATGFIHGSDDPSMGWGRYAESSASAGLDPSTCGLCALPAA